MKRKIFCVGNAHLDVVWMWRWQEGSCEAKATIRSALDRMKEYPDFRFVCSSAAVYRWIEEFDPEMFAEIRMRVREGRFIPVGGWMVQPDCNNPSGESFVRQGLYAQRYFYEKFGVTARVGYNVDSFGHHANIPMILRGSGMDAYFFMRPSPAEKPMESSLFRWRSADGSEVLAYRLWKKYNFDFSTPEELEGLLEGADAAAESNSDCLPLFYGVGNHGGGPTKRNIELILERRKSHPETEMIFSDAADFFRSVRQEGRTLPLWQGDLQHHASGCYSAVSAVKALIRRTENRLYAAEVWSFAATRLLGRRSVQEQLADAWRKLCFVQFHDSMGGCCIYDVYRDMDCIGKEALSVAMRLENNAQQSLSWKIDTHAMHGLPIVLFNPHAWEIRECVQINRQVERILAPDGREIPSQQVYSETAPCYGRNDTVFHAVIPPMGYTVYEIADDRLVRDTPAAGEGNTAAPRQLCTGSPVHAERLTLQNGLLTVRFDAASGCIVSVRETATGREWLSAPAALPVVIDETDRDTWSHGENFFDRRIGVFGNAVVTATESGPVRASVRVVSTYGRSTLTQIFSLEADSPVLRVRARVNWQEKHRMLKLVFPMALTGCGAMYEIPFGTIRRPADGEEEPGLMWCAVMGREGAFALLNDSKYSFSVKENEMALTVIRSPLYGDHGKGRFPESRVTDQGESEFSWALTATEPAHIGKTVRLARQFNLPAVNVLENRHGGFLPLTFSGLSCNAASVTVSALKRSENGAGWILRAYETEGTPQHACLSGALLPKSLEADFPAYAVKTFFLPDGGDWREVLMTEFEMNSLPGTDTVDN